MLCSIGAASRQLRRTQPHKGSAPAFLRANLSLRKFPGYHSERLTGFLGPCETKSLQGRTLFEISYAPVCGGRSIDPFYVLSFTPLRMMASISCDMWDPRAATSRRTPKPLTAAATGSKNPMTCPICALRDLAGRD